MKAVLSSPCVVRLPWTGRSSSVLPRAAPSRCPTCSKTRPQPHGPEHSSLSHRFIRGHIVVHHISSVGWVFVNAWFIIENICVLWFFDMLYMFCFICICIFVIFILFDWFHYLCPRQTWGLALHFGKQHCTKNVALTTIYRGIETRAHKPRVHDDVIKWKHFPRYWPFVRGIHRSPVNCPHKGNDAELWCFLWSAPE